MSWFFIALVGPALWAVSNHIDKYLLSRLLKDNGPGALFIFSALASALVAPFVLLAKPAVLSVTAAQALAMGAVGVLGVLGLFFYFFALKKEKRRREHSSSIFPTSARPRSGTRFYFLT